MKLEKFVNDHKLLCGLTLGFAILGYIGYRAVRWIAVKLGLVKKTDSLAQQKLTHQETNTASPNLKKKKIEIKAETPKVVSPLFTPNPIEIKVETPRIVSPLFTSNPIEDHLKIVQNPKSVQEYLTEEYKGETPTAQKYRDRLQYIEKHYKKHQVYPVRGDGNCFCNAAVAGLLSISNNRENIARILKEQIKINNHYIKPDPGSTLDHLVKFNKDDDFNIVLQGLTSTDITTQNLLENFSFTAAFSRIIRYILSTDSEDVCSSTNGEETDMCAISVLNNIFNTDAKMAVLAGPEIADPESPTTAYMAGGKILYEGFGLEDLTADIDSESNKHSFLIIRKNAHFILLT